MKRISGGFTIVELIIVIAVIGILATVTIVGLSRIQVTARDAQRDSKATVLAEALEKYYDKNGEYPSCSSVTEQDIGTLTGQAGTFEGVSIDAFKMPKTPSGQTNDIACSDAELQQNKQDIVAYIGDSSNDCLTDQSCSKFTLEYLDESNGSIKKINSRRTDINTECKVDVGNISYNNIDLSWTGVANATSYTLVYSTDPNFTTPGPSPVAGSPFDTTVNATTASGLISHTTYYFRFSATSDTGNCLSTANATTKQLGVPEIDVTGGSLSITVDISDSIDDATSYAGFYSTNSALSTSHNTSGATAFTMTSLSKTITGLAADTTYYVILRAVDANVAPIAYSDYDTESDTTDPIGTPACSVSSLAPNSVTVGWNTISGATSYSVKYGTSSNLSGGTVVASSGTGVSKSVTGLLPGTKYFFAIAAVSSSGIGAYSSPPCNGTTTIAAPPAYSNTYSFDSPTITAVSNATCAANTTLYYYWYAGTNGTTTWTSGSGASYKTVNYTLDYGETARINGKAKCVVGSNSSAITTSNAISVAHSRGVPAPSSTNATTQSSTSIKVTWGNVPGASYTITSDNNSSFSSPSSRNIGVGTLSSTYTGLAQGKTYWFKVTATEHGVDSAYSNTDNATTTISAVPDSPTLKVGTPTYGDGSADEAGLSGNTVSCSSDYFLQSCSGTYYYAYAVPSGGSSLCNTSGLTAKYNVTGYYVTSGTNAAYKNSDGSRNTDKDFQDSGYKASHGWYVIDAYSPYRARFLATTKCYGDNGTVSSASSTVGADTP